MDQGVFALGKNFKSSKVRQLPTDRKKAQLAKLLSGKICLLVLHAPTNKYNCYA